MTTVHTQSSYTKDELVACGHGQLFGPGNAQLPKDNMLMIDRITHISADDGATWSEPVRLIDWNGLDGGYPSSVERADGLLELLLADAECGVDVFGRTLVTDR